MSGTSRRPPSRSIHPPDRAALDELEELEELGDDAIVAQETAAHSPQPRATVSEESRSVVITDHPRRSDTEPPRAARALPAAGPPRKSSAEATLVIRDRRALDDLRTKIERRRLAGGEPRRALYVWGLLGLVAFVLGGVVAFLATDGHAEDAPAGVAGMRERASQNAPAQVTQAATSAAATSAVPAVRLDDLPVEPAHKR